MEAVLLKKFSKCGIQNFSKWEGVPRIPKSDVPGEWMVQIFGVWPTVIKKYEAWDGGGPFGSPKYGPGGGYATDKQT